MNTFSRFVGATSLVIVIATSIGAPTTLPAAEDRQHVAQGTAASDKAKCVVDGMEMEKSAMVEFKYKDKTLYACSQEEKAEFLKNPDKYLKKEKQEK